MIRPNPGGLHQQVSISLSSESSRVSGLLFPYLSSLSKSKSTPNTPPVLLCGTLPFLIVRRATSPFVAYVHLRLPTYARQSQDLLERYAKNLPKDAELDITSLTSLGRPRVSRMPVSALAPVSRSQRWLGVENFTRSSEELMAGRRWWAGKPMANFSIRGGSSRCKEAWVWDLVVASIKKNAGRAGVSKV